MSIQSDNDYIMIFCPQCGHKEAFVYKSAIQKAIKAHKETVRFTCNRLEKCGAKGEIPLAMVNVPVEEEEQEETVNNSSKISQTGLNKLDTLYLIKDISRYEGEAYRERLTEVLDFEEINIPIRYWKETKPFFNSIRGISSEVFLENDCCFWSGCFPNLITKTKTNWETGKEESDRFKEKLQKIGRGRNLIFPILDEKGRVGRVLLRSTKKQRVKEIQMKFRKDTPEIWNLKDLRDPKKKYIFLCEGVFDALSIKEIAKGCPCVGALSIPGVAKINKTLNYLKRVAPDKIYVLATDNDTAGKKYKMEGAVHARKIGLKVRDFPIETYKDVNEFLQGDREGFQEYFNGKMFQYETGTELNLWF